MAAASGEARVTIGRPLAEVAAFIADPSHYPTWQHSVVATERVGDVGFREVRHFMGHRVEVLVETTRQPGSQDFLLHSAPAPDTAHPLLLSMDRAFHFAPAPGGTMVHLRVDARYAPSAGLSDDALARVLHRHADTSLHHLQDVLEEAQEFLAALETLPRNE